jgi:hypothetical protein
VGERILALQPGVPHPIARVLETLTDQPQGLARGLAAGENIAGWIRAFGRLARPSAAGSRSGRRASNASPRAAALYRSAADCQEVPAESRTASREARVARAAEHREAGVGLIAKLDHRARTYEDGLVESAVHATNALEADCAHELGDLCHRDREIRAPQDGGVVVNTVYSRDLE